MTSREPSNLPEHEQRAWDAIVADLSGQIDLGLNTAPPPGQQPLDADGEWPDPLAEWDEEPWEDEDGYEPPHPPPLPKPADTLGRFAWAAAIGGPVLTLASTALGWERWISGLGVAAAIGGFAVLVARMKDERDDDGSNGAIV